MQTRTDDRRSIQAISALAKLVLAALLFAAVLAAPVPTSDAPEQAPTVAVAPAG